MEQKYIDMVEKISKMIYCNKMDWEKCESYIKELKPYINDRYDIDDCILSHFISEHHNGKDLLRLVKLFIENGFDVNGNNGRNGASCLHELCWSTYDEYILQIAELLLDAGADSTLPYDENEVEDTDKEKGVLDSISWKRGYWTIGSCESANIFEAYYKMIQRHHKRKDYHGIRSFREAVGLEITKVEKIAIKETMLEENMFEGLIFWSHEIPIVVCRQPEIYIYPQILEEAKDRIDVSNEFALIIGKKIKGLQYTCALSARLSFDNEKTVMLCNNYLMCGNERGVLRYKIVDSKERTKLVVGDIVRNIYFRDGCSYADSVRKYTVYNCFIQLKNGEVLHLYPKVTHRKANIRFEEYDFSMCDKLCKRLVSEELVVSHIEREGNECGWIELESQGKYVYLVPEGKWESETDLYLIISKDKMDNPTNLYCDESSMEPMICEYRPIEAKVLYQKSLCFN